ncbi:MAG: acetyl-CoA carboxylase biotin carboxylase subunit [Proteobacteria bacterium]|nr:acetyl-CoA carboxylase biotin carboxylase subunit [Pseudomonadota bacterium]MBU0965512.1 acetyl-CoA carboxylase biotin carboxylase subunit [Pseudomonadota bacterium]
MFNKILIANRGEIAIRVMRTCREMGIATVAVFSEADRKSLHVRYADEAYCIGPAPAIESYLDGDAILEVGRRSGVQAIHPGYGFLSENRNFAGKCRQAGLVFIGPSPEVIEQMGNKTVARKTMLANGVPVIPGTTEALEDLEAVRRVCAEIGLPVMLKAAAGGGGKGMRIVTNENDLQDAFSAVRRESYASFADSHILVERYFPDARHIEVQILADEHGNVIHLFERECSIQRRYQKVIEECPSVFVDDDLRDKLTTAAVQAATVVGYTGAGTVEFLVDEAKNFYFLEMNTRIQVEHPVTELVTGIDLVREQLLAAAGKQLSVAQSDVHRNGCAMECRIYAEDPGNDYMPAPGQIRKAVFPQGPGVRVDSGVYEGWDVSLHYDPMIAKISVWARSREEARRRMLRALDECIVFGVKTNLDLHRAILIDETFISGKFDTRFLDRHLAPHPAPDILADLAIIASVCSTLSSSPAREERVATEETGLWRMASKYQFWATRF